MDTGQENVEKFADQLLYLQSRLQTVQWSLQAKQKMYERVNINKHFEYN